MYLQTISTTVLYFNLQSIDKYFRNKYSAEKYYKNNHNYTTISLHMITTIQIFCTDSCKELLLIFERIDIL